MTTTPKRRTAQITAGLAATALFAAGCADNGDAGGNGNGEGGEAQGPIVLGIIEAWTDGLSTAYLWQEILQDEGYDVEIQEIADAAPLYTAVAAGDYHVYPSAWPEVTHASYMDEYGDDLEDLGAYYEGAVLTFAVPEYTPIDSIAELNDNVDLFGGQIVGIEPGAGLTGITKDSVMPTYELEDNFELIESSTTAMLLELETAIAADEDIVVTLWRPFWANTAFPVKDLEDPEGALGEPETLNLIANADFSSEFPDAAAMMSNFTLTDEQFGELEDLVTVEYEGNGAEGARAWLDANPDFVDTLQG